MSICVCIIWKGSILFIRSTYCEMIYWRYIFWGVEGGRERGRGWGEKEREREREIDSLNGYAPHIFQLDKTVFRHIKMCLFVSVPFEKCSYCFLGAHIERWCIRSGTYWKMINCGLWWENQKLFNENHIWSCKCRWIW